MNNVDVVDGGLSHYSLSQKITNCRWERRLTIAMIDLCINNIFQLFRLVSSKFSVQENIIIRPSKSAVFQQKWPYLRRPYNRMPLYFFIKSQKYSATLKCPMIDCFTQTGWPSLVSVYWKDSERAKKLKRQAQIRPLKSEDIVGVENDAERHAWTVANPDATTVAFTNAEISAVNVCWPTRSERIICFSFWNK